MATIGMIGVGNMGSAIAKVILEAGHSMILYNRTQAKIMGLAQEVGAHVVGFESIEDLIQESDLIFVGVKPKQFQSLFNNQLANHLTDKQPKTWVSMAAGLPIAQLAHLTPATHRWIRMMPNTPIEVGQGYIAYCMADGVSTETEELFVDSLAGSGNIEKVEETLFDAITAMAGSSPAFIYQLIEAMADAGVAQGLGRQQSYRVAAQAVKGAAAMVLETGEHPAVLKDKVTSPAGTTIAGLLALEEAGFTAAIQAGIQATVAKSHAMQDSQFRAEKPEETNKRGIGQ